MKRICLWFLISVYGALGACHDSHQPAGESNSNWLRACGGDDKCGGDELCICGVCTVPCTADDQCSRDKAPEAICVDLDANPCGEATTGAVCLATCEHDADCEDELVCDQGSCRQARGDGESESDASVSDVRDASGADAHPDAPTAARQDAGESCDDDTDCEGELHCERRRCMEPWTGPGCEPAAASREACDKENPCGSGEVCHIDGTCIEPGTCDAFGETTLAEVGDIRALRLDASHAYLLASGTEDELGNHRGDGAIQRVPLTTGGTPESVVAGISRPRDLLVDASSVFWHAGSDDDWAIWSADKLGGGDATEIAGTAEELSWTQDSTHVYFATENSDGRYEVFRAEKGTTTVEPLTDEDWPELPDLLVDAQSVFVHAYPEISKMPLAGGSPSVVTSVSAWILGWAIGGDTIYAYDGSTFGLVGIAKTGGFPWTLAVCEPGATAFDMIQYREHIYYVEAWMGPALISGDPREIRRIPITPGERETLASTDGSPNTAADGEVPFGVGDQGLYFLQGGRLVRHVLADYQPAPGPAQGATGGPCYGDGSCEAALQCVNTMCRDE